jgi:hypothetical protein
MEWLCEIQSEVPFGVKTTEAPHYRRVALQERPTAKTPDQHLRGLDGEQASQPGMDSRS